MLFPYRSSETMSRGVAFNQVNKWPSGIIPYDISAIISEKHSLNLIDVTMHVFNSNRDERIIRRRNCYFL
jgi:hypothetical protein